MKQEEYLSLSEASALLGVHRTTIHKHLKKQGVPLVKIGKALRVSNSDFQKFLKDSRDPA